MQLGRGPPSLDNCRNPIPIHSIRRSGGEVPWSRYTPMALLCLRKELTRPTEGCPSGPRPEDLMQGGHEGANPHAGQREAATTTNDPSMNINIAHETRNFLQYAEKKQNPIPSKVIRLLKETSHSVQ